MNIASLFFTPHKESTQIPYYPAMKLSDEQPVPVNIPNVLPTSASTNGFRKIKREVEPVKMKDENTINKINNPFSQALPQTMIKLLQMMNNQKQGQPQHSLYNEQSQSFAKISALLETLKNKKEESNDQKHDLTASPKTSSKLLQNVLLVNGNNESTASNNSFLNKNLYVEFLANLYKQGKQQKPSDELNKLFPNSSTLNTTEQTFPFPLLKKENSSTNNASFSHPDEGNESDDDGSNDNLKSKSKKIKKVNLLCGHYTREHYAKNLCNNCYHKYGRTKKPWNCCHEKLYAHGLCQNCYINKYNQQKKNKIRTSDEKLENDVKMLDESTEAVVKSEEIVKEDKMLIN